MGLRERGKQDKLRRIKLAAREVFIERGYENATTREIADRAEVAIATLFVYAADKRELLLLTINDEVDAAFAAGIEAVDAKQSLIEKLVTVFGAVFKQESHDAILGRYALREIMFNEWLPKSSGQQAARVRKRHEHIRSVLVDYIVQARQTGEITSKESNELIASVFIWLYWEAVRVWIHNDHPKPREGIRHLRRLFNLTLDGLAPQAR